MSSPNFASPNVVALVNFLFLSFIIVIGATLGATVRVGKELKLKGGWRNIFRTHMIGVGASFICLPFITSFLNIKYESLILPLKGTLPNIYIEQLFMLISLSGISSYLGYSLLDNIANKVIQSQVSDLDKKQEKNSANINKLKEENKVIKNNEIRMTIELLYMKAKNAVEAGQRFQESSNEESKIAASKKYNDALTMLNKALEIMPENYEIKERSRLMSLKAYTLKRIGRVSDALSIVVKLLETDEKNPVLIYNFACYSLLTKKKDRETIKELIRESLTIEPDNEEYKIVQKKLIERVLSRLDEDIKDLFNQTELDDIKKSTSNK
ncbi:tetratricopeptide repeat protein [Proteus mirabilis]|uniref:tetratricopeptide repeat protein n=1 Tax=Proteus mirabilis TaxID=584 RepID=UPI001C3F8675|nr:hypothetical protein [Proteus mirabilis]EKT8508721.1 hypothetical protein [Proteus mirabilis]